ncbi:MAG TPA: hypothetical protein VGQ24_10595 [Gemmatimonadales bacterium]|jgi:hypothetical protein|nr:hypothetical protein [Gemmatimonadales bacterium]
MSETAAEYEARQKANRSEESGILRMQREAVARAEAERGARGRSGLGFWRLVWVVALGILLAQGIAAVILAVARAVTGS